MGERLEKLPEVGISMIGTGKKFVKHYFIIKQDLCLH